MGDVADTFALVVVQPGAERALKELVAHSARHAGWAAAFQRPGVVTFKLPSSSSGAPVRASTDLSEGLVLARHAGISAGKLDDAALNARLQQQRPGRISAIRLARDGGKDEAWVVDEALRDRLRVHEREGAPGRATVVVVDDATWLSLHAAGADRPLLLDEVPALPAGAPSRAWQKLEEAALRFSLPFAAGQTAVEVGAAPGGASWALLERGLSVVGVDPNDVDERVVRHERYHHVRGTSMELDPRALATLTPRGVDWYLADVNVPPGTMLRGLVPLLQARPPSTGVLLTLKLGRYEHLRDLASWLERVDKPVPGLRWHLASLWSNGQELCAAAVREVGRS